MTKIDAFDISAPIEAILASSSKKNMKIVVTTSNLLKAPKVKFYVKDYTDVILFVTNELEAAVNFYNYN